MRFVESTVFYVQPMPVEWMHKGRPRYIYGTGMFAQDVLKVLQQNDLNVTGFLDHRNTGDRELYNLPVYHPDDTHLNTTTRSRSTIIIGIHNREVHIPTIVQMLQGLGYYRFVSPIELYDVFSREMKTRYWLTERGFYAPHSREIESVYEMLTDEASRDTFFSLLRFRITGDYSILPQPDMDHQYFPMDLPAWQQPLRLVDCGAYDGDTLRSFLNAGYHFQSLVAFEPDLENFRKVSDYVTQNRTLFPDAVLFPCGVYSSTGQMGFETGMGEASGVVQAGSSVIQCVSLDESIPTFQPALIKMDIEGAEPEALQGAEKLIRDCQPALAISAYHTPAHLWEIPLLIDRMARQHHLSYTYHLRAHAQNCFDTIFYAVPARSS